MSANVDAQVGHRAVVVRLYPTATQRAILARHFGCARFIFNAGVRKGKWESCLFKETGESTKSMRWPGWSAWITQIKGQPGLEWLAEAPRDVLDDSIKGLVKAWDNYYRGKEKGVKTGRPKYKGRHKRKASYRHSLLVSEDGRQCRLPKLGWIAMRGWRPEFGGLPLGEATVEQAPSGRYTCSLRVAVPGGAPKPLESLGRVVGLDLGLTHFAILDDGRKIENPRLLALAKENLLRKDRKFARRKKGSKQRERARVLRARAHERVKWARQDFANKLAHQLSQEADVVVVEDLAVKNMVKNSHLAKAISDVGWSGFVVRLEQKMTAKGGVVVKINRFFPSSKTCSACGAVLSELPLSVREWTCGGCGVTHDRDVNAAINIRNEGIKQLLADGRSVTATGG